MRAPEAPIGWPSAHAPPCTLTFSCGSLNSFIAAIVTAANASLISHRSTSLGLPADFFQQLVDRADRRGREPFGRLACTVCPSMRAIGCAAPLFGARLPHHHQRRRAVGDRRGIGGGDRAVFLERGLQAGNLVELGLERLLVELAHFDVCRPCRRRSPARSPSRSCRRRWPCSRARSRRSRTRPAARA